ncbi:flagellar filament capping protein FliD [bacterium]|nr:flagellar filament capping protein FliD [bacterium]
MASSSTASFSGLASGIQWADTVDMLMQLESQGLYRLEERKVEQQSRIDAWVAISSKLSDLQAKAQAIDTASELLAMNASSSDSDVISASADSNAFVSNHSIEVNQLAQQEVYVHDTGWADLSTSSLTGSGNDFAYDYEGDTYTVTLANGATLKDLIDAINEDDNNPGVTASVIDDGSSGTPFHLVLTADEAADSNSIAVNAAGTTIGSGVFDSGWVTTKDAQQAQIRVDGYPAGDWLVRSSNTIDDVITGVTLKLKDVTASEVNISVAQDNTETINAIEEWVASYNALMVDIKANTSYNAESETRGLLAGDGNLRSLKSDLMSIVAGEIPGVSSGTIYSTLGAAGIDLTSGGKLKVDDSELRDALEDDSQAVAELFALSSDSSSPYLSLFKQEAETEGGTYEVELHYLANGKLDPDANNTIGGYAATVSSGNILVGQEGTPVEGLRLYFDSPGGGAGTINATVRVGKGVASQFDGFVELAQDSVDGFIKQAKDVYNDSIESLDRQIESFERRLRIKREILTQQFLAMEQAVSQAQSQAQWVG